MKQLIVIEGPDYAGKTTLVGGILKKKNIYQHKHAAHKNFKTEKEHHLKIDKQAEIDYFKTLEYYKTIDYPILMDRFFISSIVYPRVYNRIYDTAYVKASDWSRLKLIFVSINNRKEIAKRMKNREDLLNLDINRIVSLDNEYRKAFKQLNFPFLEIDGSEEFELKIEKVMEYINE